MKALWFSRHFPTSEQLEEVKARGYELVEVQFGIGLGKVEVVDDAGVDAVVRELVVAADRHRACAVFGVFPVPVLARFWEFRVGLQLWSAWNVKLAEPGGAATFRHKQWCRIG